MSSNKTKDNQIINPDTHSRQMANEAGWENKTEKNKLVEKLFENDSECPIGNYLLFENGDMLLFEHYFIEDDFHFRILNKSTIESYFEFNEKDYVSSFDASLSFENEEFSVFVGEGSYGSEGVLYVIENKTDKLLWFLFSDKSNPFITAYINDNNEVVAQTSLDTIWKIPLLMAAKFALQKP